MKSATIMPPYSAKSLVNKPNDLLEAQLLYASIELDLFQYLVNPVAIDEITRRTGFHKRNLELILNALTAMELLEKTKDTYSNTDTVNYYLNPKSEMYIGDHLLYWKEMTNLSDIVNLVKCGPQEKKSSDENGSDFFDFQSMGQGARNMMYLGRVQNFIMTLQSFLKKDSVFKIFDMGGGSGVLAIEIVRNFPNASAVVFDQEKVITLTEEIIKEYGVGDKVKTQCGNFNTDSFNGQYDLIIASGVLDFVGDLDQILLKIKQSLTPDGYVYISTHGINEAFTGPKPFILGWLSSHLNGLDILKPDPCIRKAIKKVGFEIIDENAEGCSYMIRKKNND